jgi:AcrR family transcriptional regulator
MRAAVASRTYLHADARREQILRDARRLYARRPYAVVTTADIAEATGVSWGLVAHYFGDKRGLYLAVLYSIAEPTETAPISGATLQQRLQNLVDFALSVLERNQESWMAVISGGYASGDAEIAMVIETGRERAAGMVIAALGSDVPAPNPDKLRAAARCIVGLAESAAAEWLHRQRLTRDEVRALLIDSFTAMAVVIRAP